MTPNLPRVACGCLIALAVGVIQPDLDAQEPLFDVVSIRRNPTLDVNTATQQVHTQQNRVVAPSATLRDLIRAAYDYQFRPVSLIVGTEGHRGLADDFVSLDIYPAFAPQRSSVPARPAFEVASVKPSPPVSGTPVTPMVVAWPVDCWIARSTTS